MTPFLHLVAQDLHDKFGSDYSRIAIVFPNKRAGLFLNEYLLQISGGAPVWAPRYLTISDLFFSLSPEYTTNDPIDSALRIVRLFQQATGDASITVERFYGWAERILSDFEDVDKNMADPDALFRNISDLKSFDDTSFLTPEQVKELQKFFGDFDTDHKGVLREKFQQLWDSLGIIYHRLNDELAQCGRAYEGALYRHVIERLETDEVTANPAISHFVFVGFNVLDSVEQRLFAHLKREGRALFYWDYDTYYLDAASDNEAGLFLRENLLRFPNELPSDLFSSYSSPKRVEMIAASTEAIQAQYVAPWLEENLTSADPKRTAVVLCNENLLQPVLHALPESVSALNVTKGFPLSHTNVVTEVEHQLAEWERQGTKLAVSELLARLSDKVEADARAFVNKDKAATVDSIQHSGAGDTTANNLDASQTEENQQPRFEDILQGEAYFMMYTILNRFANIFAQHDSLSISIVTLRRLLRQVVRQSTIPFHGEPVEGLQIMGVLETRCLDFDHLIMLSVNDGILPRKASDNSFIPYLLRRAYGLTTPERRTAVYAYYFYRLLQRPSVVTLTYNSAADLASTGEMSRFMTQLLVEWPGHVVHRSLNSLQHTDSKTPRPVLKPSDILQRLLRPVSHDSEVLVPTLSPSALSTYLRCQLQFYYQQVLHLREPEEITDILQPNALGDIFHKAAELVYKEIKRTRQGIAAPAHLEALANDYGKLHNYVVQAFRESKQMEYRVLEGRVVELYLSHLLRFDARSGPFDVVATELNAERYLKVCADGREAEIRVRGVIDRLDLIRLTDGTRALRVFDYKTGGTTLHTAGNAKDAAADNLEDLFDPTKHKGYMLQTFLYGTMLPAMRTKRPDLAPLLHNPIVPSLFYLKFAQNPRYNPRLFIAKEEVKNVMDYAGDFDLRVKTLIEDILDTSKPFVPADDDKLCANCAFRLLCFKAPDEA